MSTAFFLARRIHFGGGGGGGRVSPPAIRIAVAGIAVGLAVMLVSVAIIVGFKQEIRQKVTSLDAHLQVVALTDNRTLEAAPLVVTDSLVRLVRSVPGVTGVRPFATKLCVLKTDSDYLAVGLMGLPEGEEYPGSGGGTGDGGGRVSGENGLVLSRHIAARLRLGEGDAVQAYFVAGDLESSPLAYGAAPRSVKSRRLRVDGLYETHFAEYDRHIAIAPLPLVQEVNGWDSLSSPDAHACAGLQVYVDDFDHVEDIYFALVAALSGLTDPQGTPYYVVSAAQLHPQVFGWLALLDTNVWVILLLMTVVAAFTMTGGLLIIILERTATIGILKAIGAPAAMLRRMFLYVALFLVGRGLLWGNLVGLGLCLVQRLWHPLTLDATNYYLEYVPIALQPWHVVVLNVGTALLTLLALVGPSALVAHISPTQAIRSGEGD